LNCIRKLSNANFKHTLTPILLCDARYWYDISVRLFSARYSRTCGTHLSNFNRCGHGFAADAEKEGRPYEVFQC